MQQQNSIFIKTFLIVAGFLSGLVLFLPIIARAVGAHVGRRSDRIFRNIVAAIMQLSLLAKMMYSSVDARRTSGRRSDATIGAVSVIRLRYNDVRWPYSRHHCVAS